MRLIKMVKVISKVLKLKEHAGLYIYPVLGSESPSLLLKISTCDHGDRELPTVFEINVEDMITLLLQVADLEEILKGMIECSTTKEIKDQLIERLTDRIK